MTTNDQEHSTEPTAAQGGLRTFSIVAGGQLVSLLGSALTMFAVGIWVFQRTQSVTLLSLVILAGTLPGILISPLAGSVVDRMDRRRVMLGSDIVAGVVTMIVAVLFFLFYREGSVTLWTLCPIFALAIVGSLAGAFQEPAYAASVPLLVPKQHLGRASGFVQFSQGLARVLTPLLAGAMLATVGFGAILLTDVATFLVAVTTLSFVRIPRPQESMEGHQAKGSLLHEAWAGWTYIRDRSGLLSLLFLFTFVNFLVAFVNVLYIPLILRLPSSEMVLGATLTVGGVGMMIGSVSVMSLGTPKRKVLSIMILIFLGGVVIGLSGVYPSAILIAANGFVMMLVLPFLQATSQVLWQTKVAPDMQGRVFALRRMFQQAALPAATLLAGPLADHLFEPMLAEGGALSSSVGAWIGTGPGRGIALLFIIMGLGGCVAAIVGLLHPRIRHLETELPDMVQ